MLLQAHKNNTSNYYINGKKATWKDVREKLMECDVDLSNNRFLILQGEVEQISLMKPKGLTEHEDGLLEYIEVHCCALTITVLTLSLHCT